MSKKICLVSNLILLVWFFLDMVGFSIDGKVLVTRAYREDGIFFLIYFFIFILYIYKDKYGKYFLTGWLFMWFITQFLSHWYFTLFGPSEAKNKYFSNTIKLIHSSNTYIPDLYHIVLHVLILNSLIILIIYIFNSKESKRI